MEDRHCVLDLSQIRNVRGLSLDLQILYVIQKSVDKNNLFKTEKEVIDKVFSCSHETLKSYIKRLTKSNILKFKYSCLFMLNPDVYYAGETFAKQEIIKNYINFKSDI